MSSKQTAKKKKDSAKQIYTGLNELVKIVTAVICFRIFLFSIMFSNGFYKEALFLSLLYLDLNLINYTYVL